MPTAESFLPLRSVELDILLSVGNRPMHGYAILKDAEGRTEGGPGFEIPTLYRALRRMRGQGLVRALRQHDGGEDSRRQYWQATALGREVLRLEVARLEAIVAVGRERVDAAEPGEAGKHAAEEHAAGDDGRRAEAT